MFTLYILYSAQLGKYYIGYTSNLEGRLLRHLSDHHGYTSRAKDWEVVHTETFETKTDASVREREIKSWKNTTRIQNLIASKR